MAESFVPQEKESLPNESNRLAARRQLIGDSAPMQTVYRLIDRIAPAESAVMILGETGTGKELVAQAIHAKSDRCEKPFVAINCGALPEHLIESELFGHRKGSFTGAESNRAGLFEVANGGTLFLDELGELPRAVQAKLLRFLESGEVRRIGDNIPTICNVRVVCATHRNLEAMVQSGEFREDLWFRINTFEIFLPPLRYRKEDIPQLIEHFVARFQKEWTGRKADELFSPKAFRRLINYDYPGNVRQLANTVEHCLILADHLPISEECLPNQLGSLPRITEPTCRNNEAQKSHHRPVIEKDCEESSATIPVLKSPMNDLLAFEVREESSGFRESALPPVLTLQELEMRAIEQAMERNNGNKVRTAEELGISIKTLYNKLNQSERKIA